jgi:hypothetical protein
VVLADQLIEDLDAERRLQALRLADLRIGNARLRHAPKTSGKCLLFPRAPKNRRPFSAEEAFIYDLNRFNVLTSRAKQKMVLFCSKAFLDYIPRDQEVFKHAARVRDFAYGFCEKAEAVKATGPDGSEIALTWRYRV